MRSLLSQVVTLSTFLCLLLAACKDPAREENTGILDFRYFQMDNNGQWKKVNKNGIDSYVGEVDLGNEEKLMFDLGWYSNNLDQYYDTSMPGGRIRSQVAWDTIDGKRSKILSAIEPGKGVTGIFIDSVWSAGSSYDKFSMVGFNLSPETEKQVLEAFKSLKFIPYPD